MWYLFNYMALSFLNAPKKLLLSDSNSWSKVKN